MKQRIRVLVVEDSPTVRDLIVNAIRQEPDLEVVGESSDGFDAVRACRELKPDVMTLDLMLPGLDGLAVTEQVMAYNPTPILVVSAAENRVTGMQTYDALSAGAVDAIEKPHGREAPGEWERDFLDRLRLVSRIRVITHPRARLAGRAVAVPDVVASIPRLVVIGASTGGPAALAEILAGLPADYPLPILVVVHVGESFSRSLCEWLDRGSPLRVRHARHGEALPATGVLMAPADVHLVLRDGRLALDRGPELHSCRPAVDALFASVAREMGASAVGCLLTGIGSDGAEGLLAIKNAGGYTIAQDAETSVVFGMPHAAIRLGAARVVLPPGQISGMLRRLARGATEGR